MVIAEKMASNTQITIRKYHQSPPPMAVPNPAGAIQMAAKLAPKGTASTTTHGMRLPHRLFVLSDSWPASGSFTMFQSV
jgi:hypothetical protein